MVFGILVMMVVMMVMMLSLFLKCIIHSATTRLDLRQTNSAQVERSCKSVPNHIMPAVGELRSLPSPNRLSCVSRGVSNVSRKPSSASESSASVALNRDVSSEPTRDRTKPSGRRVEGCWPPLKEARVEWRDSGLGVGYALGRRGT